MAKCVNRNTPEYKALKTVFGNNIKTDNVIDSYQQLNKTENFPTVLEAKNHIKERQAAMSLKKEEFAEALEQNFLELPYVSRFQGQILLNNTERIDNYNRTSSKSIANKNKLKLQSQLLLWNIPYGPTEAVNIVETDKKFKVVIQPNLFSVKDTLPESRGNNETKIKNILMHFNMLFPQVKYNIMPMSEARKIYNNLPAEARGDVKISDINSFYYDGEAILIEERMTDDIAIEEMLHPFIDSLFIENKELFNSLVAEAQKAFPELAQQIKATYTEDKGFSEVHRSLELVTQSLSRHFNKEYTEKAPQSFVNKVAEFIQWFANVIKDLHKFLSGKNLEFKTSDITNTTTLSDIAKLLNTTDITFNFEKKVDLKARYSLKPEVKKVYDHAVATATTDAQRNIAAKLLNAAKMSTEKVGTISAGKNSDFYNSGNFIIFDEGEHRYFDVENGIEYLSATTAIKGTFTNKEERQLNLDIGNDFDALLNAVLSDQLFESVKLNVLKPELAKKAFIDLQNHMESLTSDGSIAIPQVILFDEASQIAGTADVLLITPAGKIKVLDLKTSKNFLKSDTENYNRKHPLADDSSLKQKGITDELSTRVQHNLQINLYRRMLQNMGYEVSEAVNATTTFHIKVDIVTDKNGKQFFTGSYEVEGIFRHDVTENERLVEALIPANENVIEKEKIKKEQRTSPESNAFEDPEYFTEEDQASENNEGPTEIEIYLKALEDFSVGLTKRKEALTKLKGGITLNMSKDAAIELINETITSIELAITEGPNAIKAEYTRVIQQAIRDVQAYTDYVLDPANISNPEYINYVLNFERYSLSFNGLIELKDVSSSPLSKMQANMVITLQKKLNTLKGTKANPGLIDTAIFNYVKETVKNVSSANFTEENLDQILTQVRDITGAEYQSGDLATSRDTLLAVLDKIYKFKKQEFQDKAEFRESMIRSLASKLLKLSPSTKPNELFKYMVELDAEGIPTGYIVQRLGEQYYSKIRELRDSLIDDDGNFMEYQQADDGENFTSENLKFNQELWKKKQAFAEFWKAEKVDSDGKLDSGTYHEYTQAYIDIRKQYETATVLESGSIIWKKKRGVSDKAWRNFKNTYGEWKETYFAEKINGIPTGVVTPGTIWVPNRKYRVAKSRANGTSMLNPKYESIMNPAQGDALAKARKEFYEFYVETMSELNAKLPENIQDKMLGRIPTIKSEIANTMKEQGPLFTKMWAGIKRKGTDLITETGKFRRVVTNEAGEIEPSLPIYYTGNLAKDDDLLKIEKKIEDLKEKRKNKQISLKEFEAENDKLIAEKNRLYNKPTGSQLELDLATSLMKYSIMAENFEAMSSIEDTVNAFVKVIGDREYLNSNPKIGFFGKVAGAVTDQVNKVVPIGKRKDAEEANIVKRVKKWTRMVYYDDQETTKNFLDKVTNSLIQYSSLAYVATNPLGNINNLIMGKLTNSIELAGARFFKRDAYMRMKAQYNLDAIPALIKRTAYIAGKGKDGYYDPKKPMSKWEGMVNHFRMLDKSSDLRENLADEKSWYNKAFDWTYLLNDSFEYNVQSQTGMAILDSYTARDKGGNEVSLYNAFTWDAKNQEVVFDLNKYDVIIDRYGKELKYDDNFRYQLRNTIREVNKAMHGNYAYEDRMVMQSHNIGKLAAQFKKWVAPAIKARYRKEYYDENLGWIEGRYRSFWSFYAFAAKNISQLGNITEEYVKAQQEESSGEDYGQGLQKAKNKVLNAYRTLGEISLILITFAMKDVLAALFEGDDDDGEVTKRLKNLSRYQADRAYKELIAFIPVIGSKQSFEFIKNPLASSRTLGEIGEALSTSLWTGVDSLILSEEEFMKNKDYVYQRGKRKGQLKLGKEWGDVLPFINSWQRWQNLDQARDFYIK